MAQVEVLYNYESRSARGHSVIVRPGERYALVADADDSWWYVAKEGAHEDGFYLPRSYVRPVGGARVSTFLGDAAAPALVAGGSIPASLRRSGKNPGFRLADPNRISRSIPVDLNFVHNLAEGDVVERMSAVESAVSSCVNGESLDDSTLSEEEQPASCSLESSTVGDDSAPAVLQTAPVYENVLERNGSVAEPRPAHSDAHDTLRTLPDGWLEYLDASGRSYFHHAQSGLSRWKPPRSLKFVSEATFADAKISLSDSVDEADAKVGGSPSPDGDLSQPSSEMTGSSDSGLGRVPSLSLRNRAFGLAAPYDAYSVCEDLASVASSAAPADVSAAADAGRSRVSSSMRRAQTSSLSNFRQHSIKSGTMEKCKLLEAGRKVKKLWSSCFVYLTSAHMIFYRDEKSAEKKGNHYAAPTGVCDLRGAKICWFDSTDKKRQHVFELTLVDSTTYLFHSESSQDVNGWFHAIRQVVAKLPMPDFYPTPAVIEAPHRRSLILRSSSGSADNSAPSPDAQKKSKRKSDVIRAGSATVDSETVVRETIIERLRKFFRSRPSIDSLKERGIYKPEPVFGSTLVEICKREALLSGLPVTVPKFLLVCTAAIEQRGLDYDGLYRISGNLSQMQKIRCQVDQDRYALLEGEEDIHVLTGTLKLFFRELQEPLFPTSLTKELLSAIKVQQPKQRYRLFRELVLQRMAAPHRDTLRHLLVHLNRVSAQAAANRMQPHNLAIVFGPTLFCGGVERPADGAGKAKQKRQVKPMTTAAERNPVDAVQSNSHLAFNMIMQGQIVEYLLAQQARLFPHAAA